MRFKRRSRRQASREAGSEPVVVPMMDPIPIEDHDPLAGFLLGSGGPIDVDKVELDSPALRAMREAGVAMVVPLISQGDLIGTLTLGRRMSDQPYSTDDRRLLRGLAAQVAPAIRLAQMVRQQEVEAKERERIDQELRVAALIQQTLLPKNVPSLVGWEIDAYYRPARAVGGDFYDFIDLADGRIAMVIGDVTDKGVPAALVMATTRSTLRAAAQRFSDPGEILAEANEILVAEIPPGMFITCLFAVLDPNTGELTFANAGHNLPYIRTVDGVVELRATGMPLGLMPGMDYEVKSTVLASGAVMLLTSDGIVEAHSPDGAMFGFSRLMGLVAGTGTAARLTSTILEDLDRFCGPGHEQEDDVTIVTIRRALDAEESAATFHGLVDQLDHFSLASEEGNERAALERVAAVVGTAGLTGERLEQMRTAVAEAVMNAIEHGNGFDSALDVEVTVMRSADRVVVRISDHGTGPQLAAQEIPDLDAKLAGEQSPRGWGLFLIEQMVDELRHEMVGDRHVVELEMSLKGAE